MRTTFGEVVLFAKRRFKCVAGKWHYQQKKFYQTLNPLNMKDGRPKTYREIMEENSDNAQAWRIEKDPECRHFK